MKIAVGNEVAFNKLADAAWFEVLAVDGFALTVREAGTDYAPQQSDTSLVKQVRPASTPPAPVVLVQTRGPDGESRLVRRDNCEYHAGKAARRAGEPESACPYMAGGERAARWTLGWREAAPAYRFDFDRLSGTGILVRLADDLTSLRYTGEDAQRLHRATQEELDAEADGVEFS